MRFVLNKTVSFFWDSSPCCRVPLLLLLNNISLCSNCQKCSVRVLWKLYTQYVICGNDIIRLCSPFLQMCKLVNPLNCVRKFQQKLFLLETDNAVDLKRTTVRGIEMNMLWTQCIVSTEYSFSLYEFSKFPWKLLF